MGRPTQRKGETYKIAKHFTLKSKEPIVKIEITFQMEIFNELARIFSEDNNAWAQREVLMREGTAKFADTVGEHDRHLQKIIQKQVSVHCETLSAHYATDPHCKQRHTLI